MKKKIIVIGIVVARQFTFCFRLLKLKPLTLWLVFATCFSGISAQKTFKKLNTNFLLQIFDFQEHIKGELARRQRHRLYRNPLIIEKFPGTFQHVRY